MHFWSIRGVYILQNANNLGFNCFLSCIHAPQSKYSAKNFFTVPTPHPQTEGKPPYLVFFPDTSYFCERIILGCPQPTSGQNWPVANFRQKGVWSPMNSHHLTFYDPSQYLSLFPSNGPKSEKFPFFTIFLLCPQKKFQARILSRAGVRMLS